MTNHYTDVCEKEIESLRQQLASCDAEVANLAALGSSYLNRANAAEQEVDSLCQQLANSQKREVMLRDALETCEVGDFSTGHVIYPSFDEKLVNEALAATEPKEDNNGN